MYPEDDVSMFLHIVKMLMPVGQTAWCHVPANSNFLPLQIVIQDTSSENLLALIL
jgi:hypothetical protein